MGESRSDPWPADQVATITEYLTKKLFPEKAKPCRLW